jgi:hypothetical protein
MLDKRREAFIQVWSFGVFNLRQHIEDAILLIIDIVYGVCRIVIKSVQKCRYFLYFVNLLLVSVNYGQRTMQVCS